MLDRDAFHAFAPPSNTPLVVSFIGFLRGLGLSTSVQFGFWDFLAYDHADEPLIAIKSVKNAVSDVLQARLASDPVPIKIILVEGATPSWTRFENQMLFFAATGTGVFIRNVGWRSYPGRPAAEQVTDLRLRLAPRWAQDGDGVWRKACTKCGARKPLEGFYNTNYPTGKDPKRHICIPCYKPTTRREN